MPIPLRADFDADAVHMCARKSKDGPQARRLSALAAIYDGASWPGSKRLFSAPSKLGVLNCKGVAALLARKTDNAGAKDGSPAPLFERLNLRGPGYYH